MCLYMPIKYITYMDHVNSLETIFVPSTCMAITLEKNKMDVVGGFVLVHICASVRAVCQYTV